MEDHQHAGCAGIMLAAAICGVVYALLWFATRSL